MPRKLTDEAILAVIAYQTTGPVKVGPSLREIADRLHFNHTSIRKRLLKLQDAGVIVHGHQRSVVLSSTIEKLLPSTFFNMDRARQKFFLAKALKEQAVAN